MIEIRHDCFALTIVLLCLPYLVVAIFGEHLLYELFRHVYNGALGVDFYGVDRCACSCNVEG